MSSELPNWFHRTKAQKRQAKTFGRAYVLTLRLRVFAQEIIWNSKPLVNQERVVVGSFNSCRPEIELVVVQEDLNERGALQLALNQRL